MQIVEAIKFESALGLLFLADQMLPRERARHLVNKKSRTSRSLLARTSPPDQYIHGGRRLLMLETGDHAYVGFEMFARLCKRLCSAVCCSAVAVAI